MNSNVKNPPETAAPRFDRKFIEDNQILDRYLLGKLPLKGARELENWCRSNPEYLDELQLGQRAQGSLKLLEAAGRPQDLGEPKIPWWKSLYFQIGLGVVTAASLLALMVLTGKFALLRGELEDVRTVAKQGSLTAPARIDALSIDPDRVEGIGKARVSVSHASRTLVDLKVHMGFTKLTNFRLTLEKKDQGRALVIDQLGRDSNGDLHLSFNSSGLSPGEYQVQVDGLPFRGNPISMAWFVIAVT